MADKPPPYGGAPYPPQPMAPAGAPYVTQQPAPPGVVYTQPGVVQTVQVVQAPPKPPDYMVLSVVVLLCCNCLFGIIALIFSLQSDGAFKAGRYDEAASKGRTAKNINIAGIIITVVIIAIIIVIYVVGLATVMSQYK